MERLRDLAGRTVTFFRELVSTPGETGPVPYRILVPYTRYLLPIWPLVALGLVSGISTAVLTALVPLSSKIFVDYIVLPNPAANSGSFLSSPFISPFIHTLPGLVFLLLAAGIGLIIFSLLGSYAQTRFGEEYTFLLQSDLYRHVLSFPLSYFRDQQTGYLVSRMNNDISYLQYVYSRFFIQLATEAFSLVVMLSILTTLNLRLVLLLLLFVPVYIVINWFFIRRIRAVIHEGRERDAYVYRDLQEIFLGIEVVKVHSAEEREHSRLVRVVRDAIGNRIRNSLYSSLSGQLIFGIQGLALLVVFWVGGQDVLVGTMTLGDFVAFTAYIALFSGNVSGLIGTPLQLQPALVSARRLNTLFALEPEGGQGEVKGELPVRIDGRITFQDVSFAYEGRDKVLSGIDIAFEPGTVTAIIGKTGAGKTTLIYLLIRFYRPDTGTISLDNRDIQKIDPRILRNHISYVSQDMFLFHASVEQNIRYSKPEASPEEVTDAARKAGIHDEILAMPDGYATFVGERGVKLSAGQRQRIAIARAFLRDAPILILDEPTSHLDTETEKKIQSSLLLLAHGKTTILVTHRQSLLEIADSVYLLSQGALSRIRKEEVATSDVE